MRMGTGLGTSYRATTLRGRFQLLSMLGEGGMGAVWKGRDLLKVEARDRNPYVAIKLLQGDFREHPEAFIALQRETAKQQRLAHPNIATVYDFDRDVDTETVFMTMEVLEGQGLDEFIHRLPDGGLPVEEAMPIIEQLCEGLEHAHRHALVHSDLKPGNCFLTRTGVVKLLDFGIARASKTQGEAQGEQTLFDPGELGAITPAYATVEMFEGWDPDPSDDVYALAIMAYQLFTGRHPYRRVSAPKAREMGLKVDPVAKLTKRQNRGLVQSLSFQRRDRTASVEAFREALRPRQGHPRLIAAAAAVWIVLLGLLAFQPAMQWIRDRESEIIVTELSAGGYEALRAGLARAALLANEEQRRDLLNDPRATGALVSHFARGDAQSIVQGLNLIAPFDLEWQQAITAAEPVRSAIFALHESAIASAFAPAQGRYALGTATRQVEALERIYPGSARVLTIRNGLDAARDTTLTELSSQFDALLEAGHLIPDPDALDVFDVLVKIKPIDGQHPLLNDPRLHARFVELARAAVAGARYAEALAVIAAAKLATPDDPTLGELRYEVETTIARLANERDAAAVLARLRAHEGAIDDLRDLTVIRDDLLELARVAPNEPLLANRKDQLERLVVAEITRTVTSEQWEQGETTLLQFAPLIDLEALTALRGQLWRAQRLAGFDPSPGAIEKRRALAEERAQRVNELLVRPELTPAWEAQFVPPFNEVVVLADPDSKNLATVRHGVASLYYDRALESLAAGRPSEAGILLQRSRAYLPTLAKLAAAEAAVAEALGALQHEREQNARAARITALRRELLEAASDDRIADARRALEALREVLPEDDAFLAAAARSALVGAYQRVAAARFADGDYEPAVSLLREGIALGPETPELIATLERYTVALEHRRLLRSLRESFASHEPLDLEDTRDQLATLRQQSPDEFAKLEAELADARSGQAVANASGSPPDIGRLAGYLEEIRALFPARHTSLAKRVGAELAAGTKKLSVANPLAAHALLDAALAMLPDDPGLRSLRDALPATELLLLTDHLKAGRLSAATEALEVARAASVETVALDDLESDLDARRASAEAAYAAYALNMRGGKIANAAERERAYRDIEAQWSDHPAFSLVAHVERLPDACWEGLAGLGRTADGVCHDWLSGEQAGDAMVVVPPGRDVPRAFAVGKFEITVAAYNRHCRLSGACAALEGIEPKLPLTGIARKDAQRYAHWLSAQASATTGRPVVYRLPTDIEWRHATLANGAPPDRGINCRNDGTLSLSATLVKTEGGSLSLGTPIGRELVSATFGQENGWGLVNPLGNAQEWAMSGAQLVALGGTFGDDAAQCVATTSRAHDGNADAATGFRLVRELD